MLNDYTYIDENNTNFIISHKLNLHYQFQGYLEILRGYFEDPTLTTTTAETPEGNMGPMVLWTCGSSDTEYFEFNCTSPESDLTDSMNWTFGQLLSVGGSQMIPFTTLLSSNQKSFDLRGFATSNNWKPNELQAALGRGTIRFLRVPCKGHPSISFPYKVSSVSISALPDLVIYLVELFSFFMWLVFLWNGRPFLPRIHECSD